MTKPVKTTAQDILQLLCDPHSFESWDHPVRHEDASADYATALEEAAEETGLDESIITGQASIAGHAVALVVSEFGFLGGSIGYATAQRIIAAIHKATKQRLPLVMAPASGGTRMHEGTPAFALMTAITAAVFHHKQANLPYLVYLRHPTTGGVLASWGSAGHITLAQPSALIGFLGPRVVELTTHHAIDSNVQRAENLVTCGLIDATVAPDQLRSQLAKFFSITAPIDFPAAGTEPAAAQHARQPEPLDAWEAICTTRKSDRPSSGDLLAALHPADVFELSGSGEGRASQALRLALVRIQGIPAVFIGQDRQQQPPVGEHWLDAAALRCARRGISLASQLQLPLISVIDTPGAELSAHAEESGLAASIGKTLHDLLAAPTHTVSVLFGQGCGGGALAMLPADVVLSTAASWLSPLPPEGASAILYRDTVHAPELMRQQQVSASALHAAGLVDAVIPENDDLCANTWEAIAAQLRALHARDLDDPQAHRLERYTRLAAQ
ncbi:MAG: carboxyl transferase domain-containing protein [Corynebacterium sp.]|nr:carboxyl transferase domain-containing protein [Corynebacterium sp.]